MKRDNLRVGAKVVDVNWGPTAGTIVSTDPVRIAFEATPVSEHGQTLSIGGWWLKDICLSALGHIGKPCVFCGEEEI